jgi:hypothetical protein
VRGRVFGLRLGRDIRGRRLLSPFASAEADATRLAAVGQFPLLVSIVVFFVSTCRLRLARAFEQCQ